MLKSPACTASSVISVDRLPLCDIQHGRPASNRRSPQIQPKLQGAAPASEHRAQETKEGRMLQSSDSYGVKSSSPASNPNSYNPVKTGSAPAQQATTGRT